MTLASSAGLVRRECHKSTQNDWGKSIDFLKNMTSYTKIA
jgi:hypothetical protein